MKKIHEKLHKSLQKARKVLVTTHRGIDHDALFSMLLIDHIICTYYPNIRTKLLIRQKRWPSFKRFDLPGKSKIENLKTDSKVQTDDYDLVFVVDCTELRRTIDLVTEELPNKLVIIDHHPNSPEITALININEARSSGTEQLYATFSDILGNKIETDSYVAELTQYGIIVDTDRFLFLTNYKTFEIFSKCNKIHPIKMDQLYYKFRKNTKKSKLALNKILSNVQYKKDMAYSYVSPQFVARNKLSEDDVRSASGEFVMFYMRTIEGVNWGFIVRKSISTPKQWSVSFRAVEDTEDVRKYAEALDGGGHKYAAGAAFVAKNTQDAVKKVLNVIKKTRNK